MNKWQLVFYIIIPSILASIQYFLFTPHETNFIIEVIVAFFTWGLLLSAAPYGIYRLIKRRKQKILRREN